MAALLAPLGARGQAPVSAEPSEPAAAAPATPEPAAAAVAGAPAKASAAARVEASLNRLRRPPPYAASAAARAALARDRAIDLHADTLMWGRDPLAASAVGHVDLPRLVAGGVGVQVFGVVTRVPPRLRMTGNRDAGDHMGALYRRAGLVALAEADPNQRALLQAAALRSAAARSGGRLRLVETVADLDAVLADRAVVGGVLALEGAQAFAEVGAVDRLFAAGFRVLGPVHFHDNALGGSAHGESGRGLSPLGALVLARAQALGMVIDLAHASPALFADVVARSRAPVLVSHTGVAGTCRSARNLDDAQLRAVAATGGVVGIGYWQAATCGTDAAAVVRAIRHAVAVAGVDHVGLGSDFDGATAMPFDTTGVPALWDALRAAGFDDVAVAKIMGGNAARVLRATLPEE